MTRGNLYEQIYRFANLRAAWQRVEESDGCAGIDGVSLWQFNLHLEDELTRLHRELANRGYAPLPLLRFLIAREDGRQRQLAVPTVRDRVAQHALIAVVAPIFEAEFESCSFAYRKGRSVQQAIQQIETLREAGYQWVVEADITAYFDNIDHELLFNRLAQLLADGEIQKLIRQWVAGRVYDGANVIQLEKGLPQGAPLSPMLANLYLDSFDEQLLSAGEKLVRFADDFVILCQSKPKAEAALRLTRELLAGLKLTLNDEKTQVTSFLEGFKYLGATFTRSLCLLPPRRSKRASTPAAVIRPPALPVWHLSQQVFNPTLREGLREALLQEAPNLLDPTANVKTPVATPVATLPHETPAATESPATDESVILPAPQTLADRESPPPTLYSLRTLYLQQHGIVLRCEDEHLRVMKEDVELLSLPAFKVDQIVVFGNAHITTPAMRFCLRQNILILLLSGQGKFYGAIEPVGKQNMRLQQLQFALQSDSARTLAIARQLVAGKITNCRAFLQKRNRAAPSPALQQAIESLQQSLQKLAEVTTLDQLRGIEGSAAVAYFAALADCFAEPFVFTKRSRRPPLDPVNAMLSFGYAMLFNNLYALARARGLNPYVGSLHDMQPGHPAFCSDLLEELRAPIVDSMVVTLTNKRLLSPADFQLDRDESGAAVGCLLTEPGRRIFIAQFEKRMNTILQHPRAKIRTTWRGCIDLQISNYIQFLRGEVAAYTPIEIR